MNHIGQWDAELAWYSPSTTHQMVLYGLEHSPIIYSLRLSWPCLIAKVPSGTVHSLNCFGNMIYLLQPNTY